MNAQDRRKEILNILSGNREPVNATALAHQLGVSRQIIVGDIALLRAGGAEISATPRGYLLSREDAALKRTVACQHTFEQMVEEMNIMVDQGCVVEDVIVEHPVYGQLVGKLELSNRYEVSQFNQRCLEAKAQPLSLLTDGVHLHTLRCPDEGAYERVCQGLEEAGFLLTEDTDKDSEEKTR